MAVVVYITGIHPIKNGSTDQTPQLPAGLGRCLFKKGTQDGSYS